MKLSTSLVLFGGAASVVGHGGVTQYKIGNAYFNGYKPYISENQQVPSIQRSWATYDPILDPTSSAMVCNTAGTRGALTATISAGSSITAYWYVQPFSSTRLSKSSMTLLYGVGLDHFLSISFTSSIPFHSL